MSGIPSGSRPSRVSRSPKNARGAFSANRNQNGDSSKLPVGLTQICPNVSGTVASLNWIWQSAVRPIFIFPRAETSLGCPDGSLILNFQDIVDSPLGSHLGNSSADLIFGRSGINFIRQSEFGMKRSRVNVKGKK